MPEKLPKSGYIVLLIYKLSIPGECGAGKSKRRIIYLTKEIKDFSRSIRGNVLLEVEKLAIIACVIKYYRVSARGLLPAKECHFGAGVDVSFSLAHMHGRCTVYRGGNKYRTPHLHLNRCHDFEPIKMKLRLLTVL